MKLSAHFGPPAEIKADWLIVGVWEEEPLGGAVAELDSRLGGKLTRLRELGDVNGKASDAAARPGGDRGAEADGRRSGRAGEG
jgi:hypothetical protein